MAVCLPQKRKGKHSFDVRTHPFLPAVTQFAAASGLLFTIGSMLGEQREERLCRLWLLAIAILHWVVFGLLVRSRESAELVPVVGGMFARALEHFITAG
jgi:hypothetical protein